MPSLADLMTGVYEWTNKPNLEAQTRAAVKAACLKFHRSGAFYRDLAIAEFAELQANRVQTCDIVGDLIRFRKLYQVTVPRNSDDWPLDIVQPNDLVDPDGYFREDIVLAAGTTLNVKSRYPETSFKVQYFQDPDLANDTFSSWIADKYEDLIICEAARTVLIFDNEAEIRANAAELVQFYLRQLQANETEVQGR